MSHTALITAHATSLLLQTFLIVLKIYILVFLLWIIKNCKSALSERTENIGFCAVIQKSGFELWTDLASLNYSIVCPQGDEEAQVLP